MYLSYFELDVHRPSVRQSLANAHDMHRSIMTGFGDMDSHSPRKESGVLYRLLPKGQTVEMYVLSGTLPDWGKLAEGFILKENPKNIDDTVASFCNGRVLKFDILAEPAKKESREGKNSRRIMLGTSEEREQWLNHKGTQYGFDILWSREDGQIKIFMEKNKGSEAAALTGVRFRGELKIIDEAAFRNAFCAGIGSGKAYGMGMLMLFPKGE